MYAEDSASGEAAQRERRDSAQDEGRILGHVVRCDGARATIAAFVDNEAGTATAHWTVGRMVSIDVGSARTVGLVYAIDKRDLS